MRWLRPGQRFRLRRDCFKTQEAYDRQAEWEVLAVTSCSAKVRRLASNHKVIETASGVVAEFDAPDRATHFAPTASVELL